MGKWGFKCGNGYLKGIVETQEVALRLRFTKKTSNQLCRMEAARELVSRMFFQIPLFGGLMPALHFTPSAAHVFRAVTLLLMKQANPAQPEFLTQTKNMFAENRCGSGKDRTGSMRKEVHRFGF